MQNRISKTATIHLNGHADKVFPLFGPVEEKKWAPGWDLKIIYSQGSLLEEDMVFTTDSKEEDESYLTWTVSSYSPLQKIIKYTVYGKERVWTIHIDCTEQSENKTSARITYTLTGLTEKGCLKNQKKLYTIYAHHLKDWQTLINHFLETGQMLKSHPH